ncbi:DNA cytosine methyltransferase [Taylorella equigenitalis]|uniref:Cytosine-specific methyltransferase n=3 Tax=Taylorella equigenitalis TaxID=29575 RepID=A0A654KKM1_TAYEM|nr:DNA (cytosine-5-)-methyltransferase [Taylorella equigenitalis]ADU92476.1 DNA-cytosine methyltransferase [Taylorella equigenitalis MCE9]AFN36026.1 cytosine-specific methyltransferase [Taylorella equigenitalis ATCC 35865]ASY30658.1 DNA (cytosine-5-)-methyltransferase [Taylorella equigenitalis]ASY37965.1 DNA (cytosine-5-)-methyltransferase [Taylorella equigenitalis]ASY39439.1 DNA (cytosine-5-)-methyltransferase [Taylorella equigenitalis]
MIKITNPLLEGLTFIDLFAGIGGFRVALQSLGAKCVFSSEWDKFAKETYWLNFNEIAHDDITKIDECTIPNHDILCAGFPCQAFSISGKRLGFEDSRGTLFFDVVRIAKSKRPKVIFLENVKNFAKHDGGRTIRIVKESLLRLGYSFDWKVLNSCDYGIPQSRARIFMVAFREDLKHQEFKFPAPKNLDKYVEDILLPDSETSHLVRQRDDICLYRSDPLNNVNETYRIGIVGKGGQGERVYSPKGLSVTFSANGGGLFAHTAGYLVNGKTRRLHPRECARLMGYPDDFKLNPNEKQAYKQLGNSVVVDVVQSVAQEIGRTLSLAGKAI